MWLGLRLSVKAFKTKTAAFAFPFYMMAEKSMNATDGCGDADLGTAPKLTSSPGGASR